MMMVCSTLEEPDNCASSEAFNLKAQEMSRETKVVKINLDEKEIIDSLGLSSQYTDIIEAYIYEIFQKNPDNQK